jgi:nucleoside-diphosphate-sugar epimerase
VNTCPLSAQPDDNPLLRGEAVAMKVLVLGGTHFVGYAIAEAAVQRGHDTTAVSRGETGEPPDGVTWLRADRRDPAAIAPLAEQQWDAVLDTWASEASAVETSTSLLAETAAWYGYVSSRSVYTWPPALGSDESAPVVGPDAEFSYAANKRGAELAAMKHFDGRCLIARSGLILGPREDTGRLTWWLQRAAEGGTLVAPEPAENVWQCIDARDLAAFLLDAAERRTAGTFNLVGPRSAGLTTRRFVDACIAATGAVATAAWVSQAVLDRCGVTPWDGLPGWIPPDDEAYGMHDCDVSEAVAAGLACRPIEETVTDTWAWMLTLPPRQRRPLKPGTPRRGLTAEQEQAIWWLSGNSLADPPA